VKIERHVEHSREKVRQEGQPGDFMKQWWRKARYAGLCSGCGHTSTGFLSQSACHQIK
jgi:TPP-dependent indolepyruvate ferredoxin oxidoreductase alpha subunit